MRHRTQVDPSTGVPLLLPVRELDRMEILVAKLSQAWQRRWKTLELEAVQW
jgi:hypothetical protein